MDSTNQTFVLKEDHTRSKHYLKIVMFFLVAVLLVAVIIFVIFMIQRSDLSKSSDFNSFDSVSATTTGTITSASEHSISIKRGDKTVNFQLNDQVTLFDEKGITSQITKSEIKKLSLNKNVTLNFKANDNKLVVTNITYPLDTISIQPSKSTDVKIDPSNPNMSIGTPSAVIIPPAPTPAPASVSAKEKSSQTEKEE